MKNIDKFNSRVGIAEYRNLGIEIDSTHISNNEGLAKHLREVGTDPSKLEHTKITINAAGEIEGVSIKINNNGTLREINLKSPADINAGVLEVTASEYKMMTAIPDESLKLRQHRTKIVRQMFCQIFRKMKQKAQLILCVFTSIFVKYYGKYASL